MIYLNQIKTTLTARILKKQPNQKPAYISTKTNLNENNKSPMLM
jgi:hypothetical protein